jgi:alkylhydroperoxidase family enzyme
MDIGSAVGRAMGITDDQLLALPNYVNNAAFDARDRLVLDLAVAMAQTPTEIAPELLSRLRQQFDEAQLVELAAAIAWEHYRARFNRVFGVPPAGFSEGAFCVLPEARSR